MNTDLSQRFSVLRDEILNVPEMGEDAPGIELFNALSTCLSLSEELHCDHQVLRHDLSKRLAWGENPATLIVDCDIVFDRMLNAVIRSFTEPKEAFRLLQLIGDVSAATTQHLTSFAGQQANRQLSLQQKEQMVGRQLRSALEQQEQRLKKK